MIKLKTRLIQCIGFVLFISMFSIHSCTDHHIGAQPHPVSCAEIEEISYSGQVQDVIITNCLLSGCHGENPNIPDWSQLDQLQSHDDEIQRRITLPDTDPDKMPRKGSITQAEREIIYCWIEQGAQDN